MTVSELSDILKPRQFDVDPNAPGAFKLFKHWLKTLENFLESVAAYAKAKEVAGPNKFRVLCAYVSADVYELIEDCMDYDGAVRKLQSFYEDIPYDIFSRHFLTTRRQKPGESLQEFLQALQILSEKCKFRDVSAEEYKQEVVRDAFVNGLASRHIQRRLLETTELSLEAAYTSALCLQMAQKRVHICYSDVMPKATVSFEDDASLMTARASSTVGDENIKDGIKQTNCETRCQCFFCQQTYQGSKYCSTINAVGFSSGKNEHFSSVRNSENRFKSTNQSAALSLTSLTPVFYPKSILRSSLPVKFRGKHFTALIDSASSESYVNSKLCEDLNLKVFPCRCEIQMASSAMKMKSNGFCLVDLELKGYKYKSTRLNVFENLCSDVILGLDFQSLHRRVIFEFDGEAPDLIVSKQSECNVAVDAKSVVIKSRRCNEHGRDFTCQQWLKDEISQSSSPPMLAQVVTARDR